MLAFRIVFVIAACLPSALAAQAYLDARLGNAALNGQLDRLDRLIKAGANVNAKIPARFHTGETPLHLAVRTNQRQVVARLMAAGANVDARDDRGETPLITAVYFEHTELARELLREHGADPNVAMLNGLRPLHVAADRGLNELARLLLEHDAAVDARTGSGITPLMVAAKRHAAIVRLLLDAGANPRATTKQGTTPLMYAAHAAATNIVRMLLAAGADVQTKRGDGSDAFDFVLSPHYISFDLPGSIELFAQRGVDVCRRGGKEQTPSIMYRGLRRDIAALETILRHGCDPRAVDANGRSIYDLHLTNEEQTLIDAHTSSSEEEPQEEEIRIEELRREDRPEERRTFAEQARETACTPALYEYLNNGGDPNAGPDYSPPLIQYVLQCSDALQRVRTLVNAGARSRWNSTSLFEAAISNDVLDDEMFALLRKAGAVPHEADGTNALCFAVRTGRLRALRTLLRHAAPARCHDFAFTLIPADLYARRNAPKEQLAAIIAALPVSTEARLEDALVAGKSEAAASILREHPALNTSVVTVQLALRNGDEALADLCLDRLVGVTHPTLAAFFKAQAQALVDVPDDGAFVQYLFRHGVDVRAVDYPGRQSHLITTAGNRPRMTAALLHLPVDWSPQDLDGALFEAVYGDQYETAVLLVEAGANVRRENSGTLLRLARKNPRMHRFLRAQGLYVRSGDEALEVPLEVEPPGGRRVEEIQKRLEPLNPAKP